MNNAMYIFRNFRLNIFKGLLTIIFPILCDFSLIAQYGISNYRVYFAVGSFKSKDILVIRKFEHLG